MMIQHSLQLTLQSERDMAHLAADLSSFLRPHTYILLSGDLGMGKTVFARAFIRALMGDADIPVTSPTFNLVIPYDTPKGAVRHFDLYRLKHPDEVQELGLYETANTLATLVEWPERMEGREDALRRAIHITIGAPDDTSHSRTVYMRFSHDISFPSEAFIFAAGEGQRMRPLTDTIPKPLVPLAGRPILDYIMDMLERSGTQHVVMNKHYLAEAIEHYAANRARQGLLPHISLSHEDVLLETGGGMLHALDHIKGDIFTAINGDSLPTNYPSCLPFFTRLGMAFDPEKMDILLLLSPVSKKGVTKTVGDYTINGHGQLTRSMDLTGTHMFAGARILHKRIFDGVKPGVFSFRDQMDAAQMHGRLYGLVHLGDWHHLSTPEDVRNVTAYMTQNMTPEQDKVILSR